VVVADEAGAGRVVVAVVDPPVDVADVLEAVSPPRAHDTARTTRSAQIGSFRMPTSDPGCGAATGSRRGRRTHADLPLIVDRAGWSRCRAVVLSRSVDETAYHVARPRISST
jgi:hypothetical protein